MPEKMRVYVGTYTHPIKFGTGQILQSKGEGIYLLELDPTSGKITYLQTFTDVVNPSYLVIAKNNRFLYAVNELKNFQGKPSGSVSAFKISKTTGELTFINKQPSGGTDPCHLVMNTAGTHLYVSNFMSGSVSVFPIRLDGAIGASSQHIQHSGSSVDPGRQTGPHAHSLVFSPDGRHAFVPDLGLDKLIIYKIDLHTGSLLDAPTPYFKTQPGAGPRHRAFDPTGKYCYLINELDCTILALAFDKKNSRFELLQTVSSLPEGLKVPGNSCADIHITPNGSHLYGSNRGHNSLIIYARDKRSGLLEYVDCQPCGGEIPRNFAIDSTGAYLLCANQDTDNIIVFKIDKGTGRLSETSAINIPTPVCVKPVAD